MFFSLLSVNVRSISGKINELANFLGGNEGGNFIDCVAIQEIWNVPPGVQYTVDGYHPLFYKIREKSGLNANSGGGVGFLIKSNNTGMVVCIVPPQSTISPLEIA